MRTNQNGGRVRDLFAPPSTVSMVRRFQNSRFRINSNQRMRSGLRVVQLLSLPVHSGGTNYSSSPLRPRRDFAWLRIAAAQCEPRESRPSRVQIEFPAAGICLVFCLFFSFSCRLCASSAAAGFSCFPLPSFFPGSVGRYLIITTFSESFGHSPPSPLISTRPLMTHA